MVITPVNDGDIDRQLRQRHGRIQAGKAAAKNEDAGPAPGFDRWNLQLCRAHCSTHRNPPKEICRNVAYKKDALSDESDTKEITQRESRTEKSIWRLCEAPRSGHAANPGPAYPRRHDQPCRQFPGLA